MYIIAIDDYLNETQKCVKASHYYLEAKDVCELMALAVVLEYEGIKYLSGPTYKIKNAIRKGYFLTKKESKFFTKVNVWCKKPNGYVLSGDLIKVLSFKTMRADIDEYILNYNNDFNKELFRDCIEEIESKSRDIQMKFLEPIKKE